MTVLIFAFLIFDGIFLTLETFLGIYWKKKTIKRHDICFKVHYIQEKKYLCVLSQSFPCNGDTVLDIIMEIFIWDMYFLKGLHRSLILS